MALRARTGKAVRQDKNPDFVQPASPSRRQHKQLSEHSTGGAAADGGVCCQSGEARRDQAAELTYSGSSYCQSDKAKPRHMDGASYETIS